MELDRRALTADEEAIIAARLALQRRMLAEYERRERARKVRQVACLACSKMSHEPEYRRKGSADSAQRSAARRPSIL